MYSFEVGYPRTFVKKKAFDLHGTYWTPAVTAKLGGVFGDIRSVCFRSNTKFDS